MVPYLHPPKKAFLYPSVWPRKECTWTLNWKENLLICFENCHRVLYSYRQVRNSMMNTFIIVNITPHVRDSLEDKSMLVHSKKIFLLPSAWQGTEYTWGLIWKKSLLIGFQSYHAISYSHNSRVDRRCGVNTLLMVNIKLICKS